MENTTYIKLVFYKMKNPQSRLRIVKGKRTYASVPAVLKEQVKEMLIDLELEDLITE